MLSPSPLESKLESDSVMGSLLHTSGMDWKEFLVSIWEQKCHRFRFDNKRKAATPRTTSLKIRGTATANEDNNNDNDDDDDDNLWIQTVRNGWDVLVHMMDHTNPIRKSESNSNGGDGDGTEVVPPPPLLFRDLRPMDDPSEISELYGDSLYAAYLAGTSIVWNHADQISPAIASICENLQSHNKNGCGFPHAYANAYLTPPNSQTVPAHADDRDVLVFQLRGRKRWKVYERVPIPHPYTHQQVGKGDMAVPESTLDGPLAFDGCLIEGDVLYLPRGMVHEAMTAGSDVGQAQPPDLSFHVTVALATQDWTLAGNLSQMIQTSLLEATASADTTTVNGANGTDNTSIILRRSILPTAIPSSCGGQQQPQSRMVSCGGSLVDATTLQERLDTVFEQLKSQITAQSLLESMEWRIELHNRRASQKRSALSVAQSSSKKQSSTVDGTALDSVVGTIAARDVTLDTVLRASTPSERECARQQQQSLGGTAAKAGLTVRDGVGDDVAAIVGAIKGGGGSTTTRVGNFRSLLGCNYEKSSSLCDLTALSLAKRAVELGAFAVVVAAEEPSHDETTIPSKRPRLQLP